MSAALPTVETAGTDEIWPVPDTWAWTTMGEIADVVGGGTPRTNDPTNYEGGEIPWITPADLSGYSDKYISKGARNITEQGLAGSSARLLPEGTVLFSSRAPIGYVAIASQPVSTNQGFKSFVLPSQIDPSYVYHYLRRAKDVIVSMASGTTFLEISGAKAAEIPIPIAPLAEQRRIVAEIETQLTRLDAAVAALERARANQKRYRAAVLAEAVRDPLVDDRSSWPITSLGDLATRSEYGTSVKCSYDATNEPVLRIPNVVRGRIDFTDLKFSSRPLGLNQEAALRPGDILMVRTNGSIDLVGRTAVVPESLAQLHGFASYLLRFRFDCSRVLPEWIHVYLSSPSGRAFIERHAASSAGQHNVSLSLLGNMPIPLPTLQDQQALVEDVQRRLSIMEDMESSAVANLKRTERLRQGILRKAFAGQLVPQDPADEPAGVLLERIRLERASALGERQKRAARKPQRQRLLC